MSPRAAAAIAWLGPLAALAYWAPNHMELNAHVFCDGAPWGPTGFVRGASRMIVDATKYVTDTLYINTPGDCRDPAKKGTETFKARGVPFMMASASTQDGIPGLDTPQDDPSASFSLYRWNANGGLWEDGFNDIAEGTKWGGRRAVNHFHDPLTGSGGYTGITSADVATGKAYWDLVRKGISATQWVMNGTSGGDLGKNLWGWPTIGACFLRAFTETTTERRQSAMACAFRALGQVEHLVEDNSVPDHARDLPHPGNGFEEYARGRDQFRTFPKPWTVFLATIVEKEGLRALWDRDKYTTEATVTLSSQDPVGLDEFVNANFLAWNAKADVDGNTTIGTVASFGGLDGVEFSTIPDAANSPFVRHWSLGVGGEIPIPLTGLTLRTNGVTYPWPQWVEPSAGETALSAAFGSLPQKVAFRYPDSNHLVTNEADWREWQQPLMSHALGYAQTVLSLALQPARAEVVPSPDGDPLKLSVRLWNLWTPGGPHAVTWHIDSLQLVGVRPNKDTPVPDGDEAPVAIPGGFDVAPGKSADSAVVSMTWAQRGVYRYMSHSAVLVKAHLGSGSTKTELGFALPIPNAVVLIQQTSGVAKTPGYQSQTGNCNSNTCAFGQENGVYRNPVDQEVKGTITLTASQFDLFGRPADAAVKAAELEDVRVAGVALVALSHRGTLDIVHPKAGSSTLVLGGADNLVAGAAPGVFVRKSDARDAADGPLTFTATLHLADFYRNDDPDVFVNAAQASSSVYIAVWTTAEAVQLQRLMLWPWMNPASLQSLVTPKACALYEVPQSFNVHESRGICQHTASRLSPSCGQYSRTTQSVETMYGDFGLGDFFVAGVALGELRMALGWSNDVRATNFAGRVVPTSFRRAGADSVRQRDRVADLPQWNGRIPVLVVRALRPRAVLRQDRDGHDGMHRSAPSTQPPEDGRLQALLDSRRSADPPGQLRPLVAPDLHLHDHRSLNRTGGVC